MQSTLVAGDSVNYLAEVADYAPADGWSLRYRLAPRDGGQAPIDIAATAIGDRFAVQVGPDVTADWAPGEYAWASWVEREGERYSIARGQLTIAPDPATLTAGADTRSGAELGLKAIEDTLAGRASDATLRYKINGRELERYSIPELLKLRDFYARQVAQERRAAGLQDSTGTIRRILVRMR
jgi:hypothetical protein